MIPGSLWSWSSLSTSWHVYRADSRFTPSQWEMALLCNNVSHWLGTNLESVLCLRSRCRDRDYQTTLTHCGRVTHICVGDLTTIIGSDNGLSPGRRQAIIWTNAGILLIGPLRTNFNEIIFEIRKVSFEKMHMKMSSATRQPFCLGLNVLTHWLLRDMTQILTHFPLDKMATISQTIFSDAFSLMKTFVFLSKFHWSLFLRVQLTMTQHWFR